MSELIFIADKLSQDRTRWKYDKRKKSSVIEAITSNVKEEELKKQLQESCGKEMSSGDTFPDFLQYENVVFGPLGFLQSPIERDRNDAEVTADIITRYIEGEDFLDTLVHEFHSKIPEQVSELATSVKGIYRKSALKHVVLTYVSDEDICNLANQLLQKGRIKIDVQDLYENVEDPWIVTRYGLALKQSEEPINSLVRLLNRRYGESDLESELREYSGDFTTRLLEYCIKESPEVILRRLFGIPELRKIAKNFGFASDKSERIEEIIALVLLGLGFDVPPSLAGVTTSLTNIQKLEKDFSDSRDIGGRSGIMGRVFVEMERVLRDLTHFYIAFLWKKQLDDLREKIEEEMTELNSRQIELKAIDSFLRRKFKLEKPFERVGFGELIGLLRMANNKSENSKLLKRKMMKSFGRTRVLENRQMKVLDGISPFRSSFTHTKDYPGDVKCIEIIRQVENLLQEIHSDRICPLVMRVSREVRDEYGKSYAECIDEKGDRWLLYTDEFLYTTRPYFLHSKTPKIAVNPIIVEKVF